MNILFLSLTANKGIKAKLHTNKISAINLMAITKGKDNISLENTLNSFNKTRSEIQTLNVAKEKSKHLFFLFLTFKTITNSKKEIMIFNITLLSINLEHTVSILFKI